MAAQALYRRWRPQDFDDVIGQDPITRTLRNAVTTGRLAHAYLFTGPRGTGKTSVARIMAKAVNCVGDPPVPCNRCAICAAVTDGRLLDLVEIDAASNTGVDDVRDLRDKVGFTPNESRYKVYIVDEVHMLSTAAFNALLKTLEEPPGHVIFILATTEPHKIPDTITSRCQRFDFRRVPVNAVVGKLSRICEAEGVEADTAALEIVARSATGSIRDAESLMDMLIAVGEAVTVESVQDLLGTADSDAVDGVVDAVAAGDVGLGLEWINRALDRGADPRQLQVQVVSAFRSLLLVHTGMATERLVVTEEQMRRLEGQAAGLSTATVAVALRRFGDAEASPDNSHPGLPLELALVETVLATREAGAASGRQAAQSKETREPQAAQPAESTSAAPAKEPAESTSPDKSKAPTKPTGSQATDRGTEASASRSTTRSTTTASAGSGGAKREPTSSPASGGTGASASSPASGEASDEDTPYSAEGLASKWEAVMDVVGRTDRNLAALLKDGKPVRVEDDAITVGFFYEFHCRRVAEAERSEKVRQAIAEVTGIDRPLQCTVIEATQGDSASRPRTKSEQAEQDPLIRHAVEELGAKVTGVKDDDD